MPISAQEYARRGLSFESPCTDKLDCACRLHDKECSGDGGCSKSADTKLIESAEKILSNPFIAITNPAMYRAALAVSIGIRSARRFRRAR